MRKTILSLIIGTIILTGCTNTAKSSTEKTAKPINTQQIQYYFSQEDQQPDKHLIDVINSAKNTLDIAIYSLTKDNIVNAIIDAKKRGVVVRVITDKEQSGSKSEATRLVKIKDVGIPIKINSHSGLMHMKDVIADKSIVTTGSCNYSVGATEDNDENLVIISDVKMASDYDNEFDKMWNDGKRFKDYK